ncbi:MAG: GyrI-like domain-containing protein [Flavobacteriales bacterium]|nr:GyrI-like domain-containing protein [Flavobacteriales bacterium]MCB9365043.1 GyrI-like domain-containing protein [Flavobacteriales bacterium]
MKFIKKIVIVIIALIVIYMVLGLVGPSNYKITRSIKIAAPIDVVFNQTSIYTNWDAWSPWAKLDANAKYSIENDNQEVGAAMSWVGDPESVGTGGMVTSEIEKNKKFYYDLTFVSPWEMVSHGGFNYTQDGDSILLEWFDSGEFEFMTRPMMLFMDLEAELAPDFEKGLANIKKICESSETSDTSIEISEFEVNSSPILYIALSSPLNGDSIAAKLGMAYGEIMTFIETNNLNMEGAPLAITTKFSMEKMFWDFKAAISVVENLDEINVSGRIEKGTSYQGKTIKAVHIGAYSESANTYYAIEEYLKKNNLEQNGEPWEEYIDDPMEVKEEELRTFIYYPIK